MKTCEQGCTCFPCRLARNGIAAQVEALAERHGVTVTELGAGGRAPLRVRAARSELAASLAAGGWAKNAVARLLSVDTQTVRYWLGAAGKEASRGA